MYCTWMRFSRSDLVYVFVTIDWWNFSTYLPKKKEIKKSKSAYMRSVAWREVCFPRFFMGRNHQNKCKDTARHILSLDMWLSNTKTKKKWWRYYIIIVEFNCMKKTLMLLFCVTLLVRLMWYSSRSLLIKPTRNWLRRGLVLKGTSTPVIDEQSQEIKQPFICTTKRHACMERDSWVSNWVAEECPRGAYQYSRNGCKADDLEAVAI